MQQFVGDDGVEHAHAAFVEHAHDGLLLAEPAGGAPAELLVGQRQLEQAQVLHVALVVGDHAFLEPLAQAVLEEARP